MIHSGCAAHIMVGDCRDSLRTLAVTGIRAQTCVTSPPYFGLRDYGHAGQLGLEQTPDQYIAAMVDVFRGVRDVLADDGTLWLNIGDSYAGSWGARGRGDGTNAARPNLEVKHGTAAPARHGFADAGIKPKDLMGIPWMLAFALRADGWYLRQEIIWHKPNPMPESVTDRCTKAHESLFLLTKRPAYYFDHEAIKEPAVGGLAGNTKPTKGGRAYAEGAGEHRTAAGLHQWAERQRSHRDSFKRDDSKRADVIPGQSAGTHRPDREESAWDVEKRNRRSVWSIATRPYAGAHFATFPPALVEPCILAGSRSGDFVLDPFGGSGTTAGVALQHGRHALLCELNPDYAALMPERVLSIVEK